MISEVGQPGLCVCYHWRNEVCCCSCRAEDHALGGRCFCLPVPNMLVSWTDVTRLSLQLTIVKRNLPSTDESEASLSTVWPDHLLSAGQVSSAAGDMLTAVRGRSKHWSNRGGR